MQFAERVFCADLANFFLLQYRGVDGFLITGKNSGTHWLKFMLSCAIAEEYRVPPPQRSSGKAADEIIGHPRWPRRYRHLPWIGSSHTIPSIAFALPWFTRMFAASAGRCAGAGHQMRHAFKFREVATSLR